MSKYDGIKDLFKNPFVFGAAAGLIVIIFNILIASIAEGSLNKGFSVYLTNGIFAYLIPPAVGMQMELFRYHRNLTSKNVSGTEKVGILKVQ